jgi:ATP-binding cassette subfamily B protein
MVASLGVMFYFSPLLALISLAILPMLVIGAYRMRTRLYPATWDVQQRTGDVAQVVDQAVTGVRVVKGFGQERREFERLAGSASDLYGSSMRSIRLQARYQPLLESIPTFGQVGVLALGGWLALHDRITVGTFLAFASYLVLLINPARLIARMLSAAPQARAGAERIFELLDTTPAVTDAPDAHDLPKLRGEISFDAVRFGFWRSEPVLDGFDLRIAPGEVVALVGPSGAGKTTVASLIPRFWDVTGGRIALDGIDVRELSFADLRGSIGLVPQEPALFSGTVRENIAYARPDASEADVLAAARAAHALEFIHRLPAGLDTLVGERGVKLSGGQRQRIALARVFLKDPAVVVLDEATSSLDNESERLVEEAMEELLRGRTTLIIAHRLRTVRRADRVLVLDHGRVVEEGTHEELSLGAGVYGRLYRAELRD